MLSLFRKKSREDEDLASIRMLKVDMHSHILPGLDDGAETMEQSVALVKSMQNLGFDKLIATPHVMSDFYRNTPEGINNRLLELRTALRQQNVSVQIEAAAEYYLDEWLIEKLQKNEPLLTFGAPAGNHRYLLFEISYINPSPQLAEAVFLMRASGYRPVLAHPERYLYMYDDFKKLKDLYQNGVYFQINVNSLTGYYSKIAQLLAEKLIENRMVHFLGSDCHAQRHLDVLSHARSGKYYRKALELDLLNNSLY